MLPIIPHIANECLKLLNLTKKVKWPEIDTKSLVKDTVKYVIQINGKTRQIIENTIDLSENDLVNLIKKDTKLSKYISEDSRIKKIIFIPNKLINIIV